jgi:hypothetical protein
MRPITTAELKEYTRHLPLASEAHHRTYNVARRPDYRELSNRPRSDYDYHTMAFDRLEFRANRGNLDGNLVWYWSFNDVIVRVDV